MSNESNWADKPYELIPTPRAKLSGAPETPAVKVATMMAIVHNILLRGLNSIHTQAPHIPSSSIPDFLTYCEAWAYTTHAHHDNEETTEFPLIEELSGQKGIMSRNVEQHEQFLPGLTEFEEYVEACKEGGRRFDGMELRRIVEGFGGVLREHLGDEIGTLEGLGAVEGFDWGRYHEVTHRASKGNADKIKEVPFFITNHDVTYEGGIHGKFPPFPGFVHKLFQWWYIPYLKGAWEFSACDSESRPKALKYAGK